MRTLFGIDRRELILFVVCALGYAVIVFGWNLSGTADDPSMSFIRGTIPVIGDLPPQSVSKFVVTVGLYLMALIYGLLEIATGPYRRSLPQIVGIGVLTFLAWTALNYWVIAGFLNTSIVYGVVAVVLLIIWFGGVMRFVSAQHDPMAAFLVRYGLGLSAFITIVQLVAILTPNWRSPTQGVPVLYTLTFNALVGVFIAGVGGNMLWRERREEVLAAGRRKR